MRRALAVREPTDWFVQAHHPDMRRMPVPPAGRVLPDRTCAALVWNTFRTLALVDPSFWLRPLHARLFEFDERYRAPETLDVRLWVPVPPPPGAIDRRPITVDVILESDYTCWGLLAAFETDLVADTTETPAPAPDPIVRAIDGLTWAAGPRDVFVGVLCSDPRSAPVTMRTLRRYAASPHLLQQRASCPNAQRTLRDLGTGSWRTIVSVLDHCVRAPALEEPERQAVRRCRNWFGTLGMARDV